MVLAVRYEVLEHTADVGLKAYGDDLEGIFVNAAWGMFDLMTEISAVEPRGEIAIRLASADMESLLVDWLTELLYVHETQEVYLSEFSVSIRDHALEATVRGEAIDPARHRQELLVKAVTYHRIEVKPEEGYAVVIFDV